MSEDVNKGRGFLKGKMEGYSVEPPASVWEGVASSTGGGRGRRRVLIIWLATAASLALALSLGLNYFGPNPGTESLAVEENMPEEGIPQEQAEQRTSLEEKVSELLSEEEEMAIDSRLVTVTVPEAEMAHVTESESTGDALTQDELQGIIADNTADITEETTEEATEETAEETAEETTEETTEEATEETIAVGVDAAGKIVLDAGETPLTEEEDLGGVRKKDPRWMMGAMLSPLYSYRDAEPGALDGSNNQESGRLSYATGVQVAYRAGKRLAIESGLIYNKMGVNIGAPGIQMFEQEMDYLSMGAENSFDREMLMLSNTVGNIVAKSGEVYINNYKLNASADAANVMAQAGLAADQGITQHLNYLEVPLNLRYSVVDSRFKVQLVGGMSTNVLVNNYITMEGPDGREEIGYLTNIQNLNFAGNAGLGFVYYFFRQMSLSLEPRFRYYLNSVNDNTLPDTRPWSFGIYTGLNYSF